MSGIACTRKDADEDTEAAANLTCEVDGTLYSRRTQQPLAGQPVSLCLTQSAASGDPTVRTDSLGHFRLTYRAGATNGSVAAYLSPASYDCLLYTDWITTSLPAGRDQHLGNVYIAQ